MYQSSLPPRFFLSRMLLISGLLLAVGLVAPLQAHFIWVYREDGQTKIVFGEDLNPEDAKFLEGLKDMKVTTLNSGTRTPLTVTQKADGDLGWFAIADDSASHSVDVTCEYGLFGRGETKMMLDYSAKYLHFTGAKFPTPDASLKLDVVPTLQGNDWSFQAYFQGQPIRDVEFQMVRQESDTQVVATDAAGQVNFSPSSRFLIRAKHTVKEAGELNGQPYTERRYYCTLVMDVDGSPQTSAANVSENSATPQESTSASPYQLEESPVSYPELPIGINSFGAAVVDGQVYIMGGKEGKAHSYAKAYQNRKVLALNLADPGTSQWETAGEGLGLQGLAVVGHQGKLYRIGGLEARNKEGDPQALYSTAECLEFDPATKKWRELPPLPAPRSSLDACVVGSTVYVAGGWTLNGDEAEIWCDDILTLDLAQPDSQWTRLVEAPFRTRALALRAHHDKLIVVGGIEEGGETTNRVHILDLKTKTWSAGPDVPATESIKAFGCSAISIEDQFLVSTYEGAIFRLADDIQSWSKIHELDTGRFFHQMLPVGDSQFALIGGTNMEEGSQQSVEVFRIVAKSATK